MTLPVHLHSAMAGAPVLAGVNGSINSVLNACLVNGFNTQSVSSATASGGVVTFNYASAPGFSTADTVTITGASNAAVNGQFRVQSAASNQVLVSMPGVPDGAVGGTITMKFSSLGWTRPYSGTNVGAYRQGGASATKRYLRVYDGTIATELAFYLRGYEAMTAVSTGTGPFPTSTQAPGNGVSHAAPSPSGANPPWAVVGTPRAFYFLCAANGTYAAGAPLSVGDTYQAFFGDPARVQKISDPYACMVSASQVFPGGGSPLYIARNHSGAAGAGAVSLGSPTKASSSYLSIGAPFPDPVTGGITLGDAWGVVQDAAPVALRGFMPGQLSCWQSIASDDGVLRPGVPFTNVTGVTGRVLMACNTNYPNTGSVLLLDEDWGDT